MDAIPAYPRPSEDRIRDAITVIPLILEYFPPLSSIEDALLARALLAKGFTTAQSLWAIHDCCQKGYLEILEILRHPRDGGNIPHLVTEDNPPAGLEVAQGEVNFGMESLRGSWGRMAFMQDFSTLDELRVSVLVTDTRQTDLTLGGQEKSPEKPIGRPPRNQPRATVNSLMIDEMGRNPPSADWSAQQWVKHLRCSKSAVIKTRAWKSIISMRDATKMDRKSKAPRRYEE